MRLRAAREVDFVDRGAAFLDRHALLGDIGERADAGIELLLVGARQQAARPVAGRLEVDQLRPGAGDAAWRRPRRGRRPRRRCCRHRRCRRPAPCRRLVLTLEEDLALSATPSPSASRSRVMRFGADAHRGGAPHRADHGVVEDRLAAPASNIASATSTSPLGSTSIQRGCRGRGEGVDLEAGRRDRHLAGAQPLRSAS